MLVLSRRRDESIVIDGPCIVTVVSIEVGKVKIGILAGREHAIHRAEIYDAIHGGGSADERIRELKR